jgi:hypothetical protein
VIIIPILAFALGATAIVFGFVIIARRGKTSARLIRTVTLLGIVAVGLGFWTMQLAK